jgi:hypothetical protein
VTLAFDGGYARRTRKGPRRNFEILTGAGEIDGKIWVFASAHKAVTGLKRRLAAFVSRLHISSERPIALMTDGAESLLRLKAFLPVPTRFVLDYFHVSMKLRHIDQCIGAIPPMGQSEALICFFRSDVPRSTVSCSNASNDGSQLSEHARSAFLGVGYPTILNGLYGRLPMCKNFSV